MVIPTWLQEYEKEQDDVQDNAHKEKDIPEPAQEEQDTERHQRGARQESG